MNIVERGVCLDDIRRRLETAGVDCRVVGSLAVAAYLGDGYKVKIRDVDILALTNNLGLICELQSRFDDEYMGSKGKKIRVDLGAVIKSDGEIHRIDRVKILPQLLANIGRDDSGYFLYCNHLTLPIKDEIMKPVNQCFGEEKFITVPPETLLHLYFTRGGSLKPKDLKKIKDLARYTKRHPTPGLVHEDYEIFHEFAKKMRRDYPLQNLFFRILTLIDHISQGAISTNYNVARVVRSVGR
ncbi:hypothetical protein A2634_05425 [Candidatus Amesbacteria bacterium RIFCSPHIGHO2_01_FULL_48_32]|uniref:Uncharacterized protein n=1 Tax=Candidatus Amesbacteria bacterium RIFCSPLOWO2_01_FULL_48_25 TaxID=1797259 RepID=A0A1F4ZEN3_9BACT|nr:MAG: hypothetical protein A2634_05425 [Candidatus Amesbacteria bacterium RIFCSPHIGHO2_01_FULL_48_32]OGD04107.1 MAG: hypothetical protein A2989_01775 [Candidatus Amesbacteria bacterium RIFCSPLOWO2_01_FULL_48_25]HJZ05626.1 hypothetical protein [Patescibacteria group bacterium]